MLIGTRRIRNKVVNKLVKDIKKKKELEYLADGFVKEALKRYLSKEAKKISFLSKFFSEKSKGYKEIIKKVRGELRKVHGLFKIQQEADKRKELFKLLRKKKPGEKGFWELHERILETHSSSKERGGSYERLYKKLFKITGKPKVLVDLGCGINPFSFVFMRLGKLKFYAYDINDEEMRLIKDYFGFLRKVWKNFSGEAKVLNLWEWVKVKRLKKVDVCFLWKMTDVLDRQKGHKVSEMVIAGVPAKWVVVSFPTVTVRGVQMNQPRRKWIELMCKRLGYSFKVIKEKKEIFYIIKK